MTDQLKLTEYRPNFNDPKVKRRAAKVLAWCDGLRLSKNGKTVHHDKLTEVFGNRSQKGLAQWLYVNLLSQTGSYQSGQRSFTYKVKERGYLKVYSLLHMEPPTQATVVVREYGAIIRGELEPEYKDKGDRRYHPIQNVKREVRWEAFKGWWDYDIEACAPTLVHQYVTTAKGFDGRPFPSIERLYLDKQNVRAEVGELIGMDGQPVKELLSAVFFRANPAPSHKAAIFRILEQDYERHQRFVKAPLFKQLRAEASRLWALANQQDTIDRARLKLFNGVKVPRRSAKLSSRRMAIYLSLERQVMSVIEDEVRRQGVPLILMHDGFMSKGKVDVDAVIKSVSERTGFSIRMKEAEIGIQVGDEQEPDVKDLLKGDEGDSETNE